MRYSIMLQVVSLITLTLMGAGALFAWLQTRPSISGSQAMTPPVRTEAEVKWRSP